MEDIHDYGENGSWFILHHYYFYDVQNNDELVFSFHYITPSKLKHLAIHKAIKIKDQPYMRSLQAFCLRENAQLFTDQHHLVSCTYCLEKFYSYVLEIEFKKRNEFLQYVQKKNLQKQELISQNHLYHDLMLNYGILQDINEKTEDYLTRLREESKNFAFMKQVLEKKDRLEDQSQGFLVHCSSLFDTEQFNFEYKAITSIEQLFQQKITQKITNYIELSELDNFERLLLDFFDKFGYLTDSAQIKEILEFTEEDRYDDEITYYRMSISEYLRLREAQLKAITQEISLLKNYLKKSRKLEEKS